ncbi:MAG: class IV adenylate cyclase [Desulfobacterales bacterium]|nr:class IV adenylate cyclase [Desulfobacterales bacterium]
MAPLEIEVKFYLPDPGRIKSRIKELGAEFNDKSFEQNIRFEDPDCSLLKKNALLRLRKTDNRTELTYKGEPPEKNRDFKVHRELEITVNDFDTTTAILENLGFHAEQIYEKQRETYNLGDTVLCADQMPFGDFLEIEGRPDAIRQIAENLGLDWQERILANYLAIFERLKAEYGLSFNDITFENFRGADFDFSAAVSRFKAGGMD